MLQAGSRTNVFPKKKLIIALIVCIIVESSSIAALAAPRVFLPYWYGDFTYGCSTLQTKTVLNASLLRWISLSCPDSPALSLAAGNGYCGVHEPSCTRIYPTFHSPPGLMGLYLYPHGTAACPFMDSNGPAGMTPLSEWGDVVYYHIDSQVTLDYCAVVKQSAPSMQGFDIQWNIGTSGRNADTGRILVSVTNATIRIGDSTILTMRVTNQFSFDVNLQFVKDGWFLTPSPTSYFAGFSFSPSNATLGPGASSSIIVTVQTSPSQLPGNYEVGVNANPIYGLRFYGDCQYTPSYMGGGATTYLKLIS